MRCEAPYEDRLRDDIERKLHQYKKQADSPDLRPKKKKQLDQRITELESVLLTMKAKKLGGQVKIEDVAPEYEAAAVEAARVRQRAEEMLLSGVDYSTIQKELPSE